MKKTMETKLEANPGRMRRLVMRLLACRHDWSITGTNGFGHPSEQVCTKCGEYRHKVHDFDKFRHGIDELWITGKHPKTPESNSWLCDCKDSTIRWVDEKHPHVAINGPGWFCMGCLTEFSLHNSVDHEHAV